MKSGGRVLAKVPMITDRASHQRPSPDSALDGQLFRAMNPRSIGRSEQKDTVARRRAAERKLSELHQRKERLVEAYIYPSALDRPPTNSTWRASRSS